MFWLGIVSFLLQLELRCFGLSKEFSLADAGAALVLFLLILVGEIYTTTTVIWIAKGFHSHCWICVSFLDRN